MLFLDVILALGSYTFCGSSNARDRRQESVRRLQQFAYSYIHHFDIVFIQETHHFYSANEWGGKIIYSDGTTSRKGVAIIIRSAFPFHSLRTFCDINGRFIVTDIEIIGFIITLVCVYGPNVDNAAFFLYNISTHLSDFQRNNTVLVVTLISFLIWN